MAAQAGGELESGENMSVASIEVVDERGQVRIGPQNQWTAVLPLSPAEAFVATDHQQARIGRWAIERILVENPEDVHRGFGYLRDAIIRLTGVSSAIASLVTWAEEDRKREAL